MGNVTNQPTIPATPPAIRDVDHEGPNTSDCMAVEMARWSGDGARIRQVASYWTVNKN
jgi:hypothetical protein